MKLLRLSLASTHITLHLFLVYLMILIFVEGNVEQQLARLSPYLRTSRVCVGIC